ncbi:Ribokinase-like protein [Metschnikowia bicuspidata]|uniref:pyridoxal kinase n=1 Tax=Metschnikowia bicuspidata TaxID=27322 RepID=A0A4V1J336_9ASCO|nr:Ribokinase-like protein [Metschnikowia bicuspidata]
MKSLLSIQSNVAHGYVGGRAATFPLQYLGWNVDNINTVNFSNHTGYGHFQGSAISGSELTSLFKGLHQINCKYDVVILGYIPSADLIDIVSGELIKLKEANVKTLYVCDTVMCDQGHIYVDKSCVQAYRRLLATGVADVITPNQFELELLYGQSITNSQTLRDAIAYMHNTYKISYVVLSSLSCSVLDIDAQDLICCVVSCSPLTHEQSNDTNNGLGNGYTPALQVFCITEIKSYFTGVGDLFTALLADKLYASPDNVGRAVNQVLTIMSNVLRLTHQLGVEEYKRYQYELSADLLAEGRMNDGDSMRFFELRVVQSREYYDYKGDGVFESINI